MIETCRRRYFNVVKIPAQIYKEHRKLIADKDNVNLTGTDTGLAQRVNGCISDSIESNNYDELVVEASHNDEIRYFQSAEEEKEKILQILNKYLSPEEVYIFTSINGFYCEKIRGIDVAEKLNISKPAVSKKNKRIKNILSEAPEIKELYKYYKENNIF